MALRGFLVKSTECVSMINFHLMKYFHFGFALLHLPQSMPSALFPFCPIYGASQLAWPSPSPYLPSQWQLPFVSPLVVADRLGVMAAVWIFPLSRFSLHSFRVALYRTPTRLLIFMITIIVQTGLRILSELTRNLLRFQGTSPKRYNLLNLNLWYTLILVVLIFCQDVLWVLYFS